MKCLIKAEIGHIIFALLPFLVLQMKEEINKLPQFFFKLRIIKIYEESYRH